MLLRVMATAEEAIAHGRQARRDGDLSAARAHYAEAATRYREADNALAYAHTIRHIADMLQDEANLAEAEPLYAECLEIYRTSLHTKILDLANALRPYALLQEAKGNLTLAKELWEEAHRLYGSLRLAAGMAECESHIGKLLTPY